MGLLSIKNVIFLFLLMFLVACTTGEVSTDGELIIDHEGDNYEVEVQSITEITNEQESFDVQEGNIMVNIVVEVENTGSETMFMDIDFYDDISLVDPETNNSISDPYIIDEEEDITPNIVEIREEDLEPNEEMTLEIPLVISKERDPYHLNFYGEVMRFSKEDVERE
ncbi:DUF4352 domain-containing protein [Salsuginibacillus kocurii]|uniref:DUF4352 domain-containing protein n=1 Tax=Salsuginibacillus kocurii TaxID=427078 RepID=UPI000382DA07|nr:DUF4352 domain-containing protein [Salsuginibacillus kocurii]